MYQFLDTYLVTCKRLLQEALVLGYLGTLYNLFMTLHWFKRLKEKTIMPLASIE